MSARWRRVAGFAIGVLLFAVYLVTLAPTIDVGDSGELTAAAATLGIAHPPGYPLYCLVTHPFTRAFPNPALGANVASAICAAAAGALFLRLACACALPLRLAVPLTLVHGLGATLWSQAVIAEVYALNLVLVLAVANAHLAAPRADRALPFLAALTFVSHGSNGPWLLLVGAAWTARQARAPDWARRFGWGLAAAVVGLLPLLYLPLRARRNPLLDWGHPATPDAFLAHLTRRQYGGFEWPGLHGWFALLGTWLAAATAVVSVAGIAAAAWALWRARGRGLAATLASWVLASGPVATLLAAGLLRGRQLDEAAVFFLPSFSFLLLLAGRGLLDLSSRVPRWAAPIAVGGWAVWLVVAGRPDVDKSGNYVALDYGSALLAGLPPDAVLFVDADHEALPLVYLKGAMAARPDVSVRFLEGPPREDAFGHPAPDVAELARPTPSARPVFVTVPRAAFAAMPVTPQGLAFRCASPQAVPSWQPVRLRRKPGTRPTVFERTAEASVSFHEAAYRFAMGDGAEGRRAAAEARRIAVGQARLLNDVGVLLAENGLWEDARGTFGEALEADERYMLTWRNLIELEIRRQDLVAARALVDRALAIEPGRRDLAELRSRLGGAR